jgi:N4-(beta-N-acetylglucosaminyl)-L-asparaginase
MKRRDFIRSGVLLGAGSMLLPKKDLAAVKNKAFLSDYKPIVLSTWNHGIEANAVTWNVIEKGGNALDAVEKGLRVTESEIDNRSVGIGGRPDMKGHVTLDACIMDHEGRCGSVAFLEGIDHPISVARAVMDKTQHVMLVGKGAYEFARSEGFSKIKTPLKVVKKDYQKWKSENKEFIKKPTINHENHDTIGMIALDQHGNLSGGCTTSGWAYKMHGRVGDSPIIGAGLFVDNEVGACTATGLGEAIIRIAGSHTVVEMMRHGMSPQEACEEAVKRIVKKHKNLKNLQCAFIALNKQGEVGAYSVYNGFNYAVQSDTQKELVDASFDRKW